MTKAHQFMAVAAIAVVATTASAQEVVSFASANNRQAYRGETTGSQTALSLDRGDVSAGDSRRDLIAGAPGWSSDTGRVYVVFAGPVPGGEVSLSAADVIISGGAAGDRFGAATAAGFVTAKEGAIPMPNRDLVVGAPGANSGAGAVYLYHRGLTNGLRLGTGDALLTISGAPAGAHLGAALATGDLDGDGYREIIIGAPGIGAVYVIHGGASISGTVDLSTPSSAFFKIQGVAADGIGASLAAGDLTGHAISGDNTIYDLAIGAANENSNTGAVYVIKGRTSNSFPSVMTLATDADARYGGIDAGDFAGQALQIAYVDKDRYADLIIGAPAASGPGNGRAQSGEIYIVWGAATIASRALSAADVTIYGAVASGREGTALAYGDVNRDGTNDFVSLAPAASSGGEVHLFYGRSRSAWPAVWDMATTFADRYVYGNAAEGTLQTTVLYDATGEGFDDIAGGIPAASKGLVYVSYTIGPAAASNPFSHTVNPSVLTSFTASASGSPNPLVQWQVSADGGSTWTNIAGATSMTYSFVAVPSDSGKKFRAMFTNSVGSAVTGAATLTVRSVAQAARAGDLDGDGRSDLVVWRASTGMWYSLTSGFNYNDGPSPLQWGSQANSDKPYMADVDGDGIMDLVVWRPANGTWYWLTSSSAFTSGGQVQWGNNGFGDKPFVGDVDGDGKADFIIWRPTNGVWYWITSSSGYSTAAAGSLQWGNNTFGDIPFVGDFDGDGKADFAVWRGSNSVWYWVTSSTHYAYGSAGNKQWGNQGMGDKPFIGDFDGDGKADIVVWRPGNGRWYWLTSSSGFDYASAMSQQWGNDGMGDIPQLADFDGDGRPDLAVWRPSNGTWYWLPSSSGYNYSFAMSRQFGNASMGDVPVVK